MGAVVVRGAVAEGIISSVRDRKLNFCGVIVRRHVLRRGAWRETQIGIEYQTKIKNSQMDKIKIVFLRVSNGEFLDLF